MINIKSPTSQENAGNDSKSSVLPATDTAVLVIGGSLVGLSAAMFLAWQMFR